MGSNRSFVSPLLAFLRLSLLCLVVGPWFACNASQADPDTTTVLFVGNSILYYEDVPQMLVALAASQDNPRTVEVELLAEGGFSLAEHVETGVVQALLASGRFDYLVLQDVGGWPYCGSGNERCAKTAGAIEALMRVSRSNDAVPVWLGTWHPVPAGQDQLSKVFEAMSERLGIRAIDAGRVLTGVTDPPSPVFLPDYHPGEFGSWLLAGLIYREIFSSELKATNSSVGVCRSDWIDSGLNATSLASEQTPAGVECGVLQAEMLASIVVSLNGTAE